MDDTQPRPGAQFGSVEGLFDEWVTHRDLARALGISEGTLHRWHSAGTAPSRVKAGLRVLYRKEAVREWLRAQERAS
ncbi:MAG: helix-turn-helix domain-containing protein [Rhodobacteraceae bacterium]|nr:helix-turn-helix domain-containing protein [Paracoccaceae bacterium]